MKELLANSLDVGATKIDLTCGVASGTRRDRSDLRAFAVACVDNGRGCAGHEILRRIGSSTSDLHAEARGRFGQGLIDVPVIADSSEVLTFGHRLRFDQGGCRVARVKSHLSGMRVEARVRHGGAGFDDLDSYFSGIIVPDGVAFSFEGRVIASRQPTRVISDIRLQTVTFDPDTDEVRRHQRLTSVEIHPKHGETAMIYELGILVDAAPWELPYDIDVLQKTPLDVERNMLPSKYSVGLISKLVGPMSGEYIEHMSERDEAPPEIKDDRDNANRWSDKAKNSLVETVTGAKKSQIVRRNPLDPDDISESQELETKGFSPFNRGTLPAGVSEVLKDTPTVAEKHGAVCKPHFRRDPDFPPATERQKQCMAAFEEIASALLGKRMRCDRVGGGGVAADYGNGVLRLNIDVDYIWTDPLGEETLGLIIHECAHEKVSGHAVEFRDKIERLGGRLARWVGNHPDRWDLSKEELKAELAAVSGEAR